MYPAWSFRFLVLLSLARSPSVLAAFVSYVPLLSYKVPQGDRRIVCGSCYVFFGLHLICILFVLLSCSSSGAVISFLLLLVYPFLFLFVILPSAVVYVVICVSCPCSCCFLVFLCFLLAFVCFLFFFFFVSLYDRAL